MDEIAEIYWIDDERNAVVVDHRKPGGVSLGSVGSIISGNASGSRPITVSNPSRTQPTVVRYPATTTRQPIVMTSPKTTLLGGLSIGALVNIGAQLLSALQPLPASPMSTGDVGKDLTNLVTYQAALANHAKVVEKIRTVGSLADRLVK